MVAQLSSIPSTDHIAVANSVEAKTAVMFFGIVAINHEHLGTPLAPSGKDETDGTLAFPTKYGSMHKN